MEKRSTPPAFTADAGIYSRTPKGKGAPPAPPYMTAAQAARYSQLIEEWGEHKDLTPGDRQLIGMTACVEVELGKLQQFVNEHGPTYVVRGKSGDTYTRARPEYQQLQEARQRLSVLVDKLTNRGPSERPADAFIAM